MLDALSFWIGLATGVAGFISLGLALGAISVRITVDKDGVKASTKRER